MTVAPVLSETAYGLAGTNVGPFATAFAYEAHSDLLVYLNLGSEMTLLAYGSDYTLVGLTPLLSGGQVTLASGLPGAGWPPNAMLILRRAVATGQGGVFPDAGAFSPATFEAALDHLARQLQDQAATQRRALTTLGGNAPYDAGGRQILGAIGGTDLDGLVTYAQLLASANGGLSPALANVINVNWGRLGNLNLVVGEPTNGPGGAAYDGGILFMRPLGDYQVGAFHIFPTANSSAYPAWGPRAELVISATSYSLNDYDRFSITQMADWAGPALSDTAGDIRFQQEAAGAEPLRHIRFSSQRNDNPNPYVEYLTLNANQLEAQFFRRTDDPAPTGDQLTLKIGAERRALGTALTSAGHQNSPTLELFGLGYDVGQHPIQYRQRVVVETNDGTGSRYVWCYERDADGEDELLALHNNGLLVLLGPVSSFCLGGATAIGVGNSNMIAMKNGSVFSAAAPTDCALMGVTEYSEGHARWFIQGEDGYAGYVMANNDLHARGADATGSNVFSANGNALGPNDGFMVVQAQDTSTVFIPFWRNDTP